MKTAKCEVFVRNYSKSITFQTTDPEYMIADAAYLMAIAFAEACAMREYGHALSDYELALFLEDLDYDYTIS